MKTEHKPKPIPLEHRADGFIHTQIERTGDVAIYDKKTKQGQPRGFEVIIVRIAPERRFPNGIITPIREFYPSPNDWGTYAWTLPTLKRAQEKSETLRQISHPKSASAVSTPDGNKKPALLRVG